MAAPALTIRDVREDVHRQLVEDVRAGLSARPKTLRPRWFYDARGSELFEAITELPEYYLTRAEAEILSRRAPEIAALTRPETLVELGSGASKKSRLLIDAARRCGSLKTFVPFDIDEDAIRRAGAELAREFPGLTVSGIAGDFNSHLDAIPEAGPKLIAFLGSTIGNLDDTERSAFLAQLRRHVGPGDAVLIGVDLVKDAAVLLAAYDDAAGLTAEFNRNLLRRLNRELDADFDVDAFAHVAAWNSRQSRIEMHLRAVGDQQVAIPGASLRVGFRAGETVRTEISVKFTRQSVERALAEAGLRVQAWLTDEQERFALALGTA